jgi:hypothetical protein
LLLPLFAYRFLSYPPTIPCTHVCVCVTTQVYIFLSIFRLYVHLTPFGHVYLSIYLVTYKYCHVYEWLQTEFGVVIEFIELLLDVGTSNYSAIANSHFTIHCSTHLSLPSMLCLHQSLSGDGFKRRIFPFLWVPGLSLYLGFQFLTATSHNDWTAEVLYLTHSPTKLLHYTTLSTNSSCL